MMNKTLPAQERGLILLIGLAVLASGVLVFTDLPRTGEHGFDIPGPIALDNVMVVIPQFVEPEPLDINRATQDELITLPGIGPALAQRIIDYRCEHGPFQAIEELQRVSGIGPQTVQGILDAGMATVGSP